MNRKKAKKARALIREIFETKRKVTSQDESLIRRYSKDLGVDPNKVIYFFSQRHEKTKDCEGCSCHTTDPS